MSRAVAPSIAAATSSSRDRCDWSRSSAARSPDATDGVEREGRRQRARGDPFACGIPRGDPDEPRQDQPRGDREGQQDPAGDGIDPAQQHAAEGDRARGRDRRDGHAGERLLQRPDVGRDAGEQVAAARRRAEPGRGQRLDRSAKNDARRSARTRKVPAWMTIRSRYREPERTMASTRTAVIASASSATLVDGLGAADEVGGRRDQRDVRDDGHRRHRGAEQEPAGPGRREAEDRRGSSGARGSRTRPARASSSITASAPSTSAGRCEITTTVRPRPSRSIGLRDGRLGVGIEVRGRLVEDHEVGIAQERARDRDPLPLAAAQPDAVLADGRLVAVGQVVDERRRAGGAGRGLDDRRRRVASGRASRMLSATVPWNRCGDWGTYATPARQAGRRCRRGPRRRP